MDTYDCDVIVIGAGVIGLAVGRAVAQMGRDVLVLEAAGAIGTGISSRNSEVIHSGIYYPKGSAKARLCVDGRARLYAYCAARDVATRACGKLIVACGRDELSKLEALCAMGRANGVDDLRFLDRREIEDLEPALDVEHAILCPSTGVIDSHGFMLALKHDLETMGGAVCLATPVKGGDVSDKLTLWTGGSEPARITATAIVNAAGLNAAGLVHALTGFPDRHKPPAFFAKGNYFALTCGSPFRRLVYPLPEPGGLGVHATIDLAGRVRFGPDVEWVESTTDFAVDPARSRRFYASIRRFWPGLPDDALQPDYAGIRPKLTGPGEDAADFTIQDRSVHGIPGLINLLGIESPGLTSSLAIGAEVANRIAA